jgi:hypothetical protein
MATRSLIHDTINDRWIYVHFDGYLSGLGVALGRFVFNQGILDSIMEDGDHSCILIRDGKLYRETYRSRGEDCPARVGSPELGDLDSEFVYRWEDGWLVETVEDGELIWQSGQWVNFG